MNIYVEFVGQRQSILQRVAFRRRALRVDVHVDVHDHVDAATARHRRIVVTVVDEIDGSDRPRVRFEPEWVLNMVDEQLILLPRKDQKLHVCEPLVVLDLESFLHAVRLLRHVMGVLEPLRQFVEWADPVRARRLIRQIAILARLTIRFPPAFALRFVVGNYDISGEVDGDVNVERRVDDPVRRVNGLHCGCGLSDGLLRLEDVDVELDLAENPLRFVLQVDRDAVRVKQFVQAVEDFDEIQPDHPTLHLGVEDLRA